MQTRSPSPTRVIDVARKKPDDPKKLEDKQITFRISGGLHRRLESAAEGLSLDISSLLRLMIRQNLPTYESQAEEVRRREGQDL
jgi:predicted HicB family RNase H-like nuclease